MKKERKMKYFITASFVAVFATASMVFADDTFSGVSGNFGGGVSTSASSGGFSATGSFGDTGNTSIRSESGSGEFAGASVNWDSSASNGDGDVTMGAESFTDGFDFSRSFSNGGFGASMAERFGSASAGGAFGGSFSSTDGDTEDFPGLGLGHGGFDDGNAGNWENDDENDDD